MKDQLKILGLIFKREIYPASDGIGLKQVILYRLPVFFLPIAGVILLLIIASYSGLCLVGAEQGLERRFEEFKTSPFTALFGKAPGFYLSDKGGSEDDNFFNLYRWMNITTDEIPGLSEFPKGRVFSSVKPFSKVYGITVRQKDGGHLPDQPGMSVYLQGEYADEPLIREIKKLIIKGYFPDDETEQGIIVSAEGMKRFGWTRSEDYPDFLWVKLSELKDLADLSNLNDIERNIQCVPLRVCVVSKLPGQFLYVLSSKQYHLLNGDYYNDPIQGFDIIFVKKFESEEIKKILPVQRISLISKSGKEARRITLSEPVPRIEILEKFEDKKLLNKIRSFYMRSPELNLSRYNAGIFHLNFQLMDNINKHHIYAIQNFMNSKEIAVEGELVELLSIMINTQNNLKNLQSLFNGGLWAIGFVLFLFFTVVLHNRIHRIGTNRMLGVSEWVFVAVYSLMGLSLLISAFVLAIFLTRIYRPADLEIVLLNFSVFKLFLQMLCIAELGFLIPVLFFIGSLRPSEMIAYRS